MKHITTLLFIITSVSAFAQKAVITTKADTTHQTITITATTNDALYIKEGGSIPFKNLSTISFGNRDAFNEPLYKRLTAAGVQVSFGEVKAMPVTSPILVKQGEENVALIQRTNYDKFISQRNAGKVLQLIGVGALAYASYAAVQNANTINNNTKNTPASIVKVPSWLPLAGFGLMGIGLVIDIDAGHHLRNR